MGAMKAGHWVSCWAVSTADLSADLKETWDSYWAVQMAALMAVHSELLTAVSLAAGRASMLAVQMVGR